MSSSLPRPAGSNLDVYIVGMARTPIGKFGGALASVPAVELGAVAIRAAVERAGLPAGTAIDEVLMGQVLQAGAGQAPARQAALRAGLATSTPATTINRVCGSGLKALMLGAASIRAGDAEIVVAGGIEQRQNRTVCSHWSLTGIGVRQARTLAAPARD